MKPRRRVKVLYVVCYRDPNYIRTQTLIGALKKIDSVDLTIIKNKQKGIFRYIEVSIKLLWARISLRPDVFFVGFRGHEVFWLLYPSMAGKKIIFDEFINLHDWLVNEHHKLRPDSLAIKIVDGYMRWVIGRVDIILADTEAHAELSRDMYRLPKEKVIAIPISADENTFYPRKDPRKSHKHFEVFFFGTMLPLHGMAYFLDAIRILSDAHKLGKVHFTLAGGKGNPQMLNSITSFIRDNKLQGAVRHIDWIPYDELPDYIAAADLCIGGPFGNTGQALRVITGKTYQFIAMGKATLVGKGENRGGFIDKKNSLLVNQGSAQEITDALYWAATHPKEIKRIGVESRKLYGRRYSIVHISEKLAGLIYE